MPGWVAVAVAQIGETRVPVGGSLVERDEDGEDDRPHADPDVRRPHADPTVRRPLWTFHRLHPKVHRYVLDLPEAP